MYRLCAALCLAVATPAFAGEVGGVPHLALGGYDLGMAERRAEVLEDGGVSLGAVTATPGRLATGGYLAYALRDYKLSSSLAGDAVGNSAGLSAAYSGSLLGTQGTAALRLGYDWPRSVPFSPNFSQPGADPLDLPRTGPSLSLSWSHDLTPGLSLGGFATAGRLQPSSPIAPMDDSPDFRVGAGVGVKF